MALRRFGYVNCWFLFNGAYNKIVTDTDALESGVTRSTDIQRMGAEIRTVHTPANGMSHRIDADAELVPGIKERLA